MHILSVILFALSANIDCLVIGLSYSLKKTIIDINSNLLIAFMSTIGTYFSMMLGSLLTPIFQPLGLNDWRISTAFITGFMAKESVVSTLSVLAGNISEMFTPITAFVFMVFCLLYTPCVAAIATVRRELGRRYAVMVVLMQCSIAWLAAFAIYRLASIVF